MEMRSRNKARTEKSAPCPAFLLCKRIADLAMYPLTAARPWDDSAWAGTAHMRKTSYAPAFACVRGAPVAHEVLFLFNTHCIRLCPAAEKLQISCRAGRVCPLLCPPVKAQSDENQSVTALFFLFRPHFPLDFFSIYLT